MPEIVGVRFDPLASLVFCRCELPGVAAGCEVVVSLADGQRRGVIEVPADQIVAPDLPDAPRVISVQDAPHRDRGASSLTDDIDFVTAPDGGVELSDLEDALKLAALPVPETPEPRRR
jgi:hypothetical protein